MNQMKEHKNVRERDEKDRKWRAHETANVKFELKKKETRENVIVYLFFV